MQPGTDKQRRRRWRARGSSPLPLGGLWETTEFSLVLADGTAAPQLVPTGQVQGATLRAVLQKREPESFPIHGRGFHWLQEHPFNNDR